jgi:lipopolysaccharide transport system ATP-binding protein
MTDTAIKVENLGKRYRTGQYVGSGASYMTLRESLTNAVSAPFRRLKHISQSASPNPQSEDPQGVSPDSRFIWALRDVSFKVRRGEVLGIIGRNGAGKSTLLKILTRITEPTEGRAELQGRVGSLLEVGTGFHPELTGRENIYLSGTILGMSRREVDLKFDEIVDFSGVESYIDTPVKRYSSGMRVRLGFAVAAHLEPEILLIDEVLAVGDAAFQKKCLGKMGDVAKEGRTVLFVSHNMGAITRLCERSILLSQGVAVFDGESDVAVRAYLMDATSSATRSVHFEDDPSLPIVIRQVAVTTPGKTDNEPLDIADPLYVEIQYHVRQNVRGTSLSFALKRDGIVLFRSWDIDVDQGVFELREAGDYISQLALPQGLLAPGMYSLYIAASRPGVGLITTHDGCLMFELEDYSHDGSHSSYSRGGLLIMPLRWETRRISKM